MTEAEKLIKEFRKHEEDAKELFVDIGMILHNKNCGIGMMAVSKTMAMLAVMASMPRDEYMDVMADAYDDCVNAQQEEGLKSLH
jgi:alkylhydroperoxidase/carboxymuconolactone decarboxylase family protein YurZ